MAFVRTLARPLLASSFVLAGLDKLKNADDTTAQLSPLLRKATASLPFRTEEKTLARVIGGVQVGAGVLFGLGKFCQGLRDPPHRDLGPEHFRGMAERRHQHQGRA